MVWNVTGSRPYASLPTCRQLLNDVVDEFPHAERPRVEGEYMEAEEYTAEYEYLGEEDLEGLEGVLQCNARETADTGEDERDSYAVALMWVNVSLYDAEDERVVEDLRTGIEEEIEDFEDGKWWGDELDDFELIDWTELTTGDGGRAMLHETSYGERVGTATARFVTANASVNISYTLEERYDEREEIEFLVSFSEQLERQLAREAERG